MAQVSSRRSRAPLQYSVVEQLCVFGRISARELCYFTGASVTTLKALEKGGLCPLDTPEALRRRGPPSPLGAGPGRGGRQQGRGPPLQQSLGGRVRAAPRPHIPRRLLDIHFIRPAQRQDPADWYIHLTIPPLLVWVLL